MNTVKTPQRVRTGIAGLDEILHGGLPAHRLYLLQGDPGVGKTTLALQFLLEGVRLGEPALYITLSETREELVEVANSHGWSLEGLSIFELSAMEQQLAQSAQNTLFHPADVELNSTTQMLLAEIERVKPNRIAFDSLSELRLLADNPLRYRRQMLSMKQFFVGRKCTTLYLDDRTGPHASELQVQSISHGVITLEKRAVSYGNPRRSLTIDKVRGVKFIEGSHDYAIETGGIVVFPRLVASGQKQDFTEEPVSSGIKGLDALLGGGLDRGTSALLMGPAGTGKSSISFQHVITAAMRGEKSLVFLFDEDLKTITRRTSALGLPLVEHTKSGCVDLRQLDPAEVSPGEFATTITSAVLQRDVRIVVIDSLSGYMQAMPDENTLMLQLHELLTFLRQHGVVTIMTLAQHGVVGTVQAPIDATYIADTVIMIRFFEAAGHVRKAVSVVKKRSGVHEDTIREFRIDQSGIQVGPPLTEFHGILSGVPTFHGDSASMLKNRSAERP